MAQQWGDVTKRAIPLVKFHWAGFSGYGHELQGNGWEISAYQDLLRDSVGFALKHPGYKVYGLTKLIPMNFDFRSSVLSGLGLTQALSEMDMPIQCMSNELRVHIHEPFDLSKCKPVDMTPDIVDFEEKSIEELCIFKPIGGQEIWVDKANASDLLTKLVEMQAPKQKEIREKARKAERREWLNNRLTGKQLEESDFHSSYQRTAQILAFG